MDRMTGATKSGKHDSPFLDVDVFAGVLPIAFKGCLPTTRGLPRFGQGGNAAVDWNAFADTQRGALPGGSTLRRL
eukprot:5131885-Heterocapsa_arctica.AAC.1